MTKQILLEEMLRMPIGDVASLPPRQLLGLIREAEEQQRLAKLAHSWLHGALARKYGKQAASFRSRLGQGNNTICFDDDGVTVTCELPKEVEWDPLLLPGVVLRLMSEGRDISGYVEHEYRVLGHKYHTWPEDIRIMFEKARIVRTGREIFRLGIQGKEGHHER